MGGYSDGDSNGGDYNDGRVMIKSSCQEIAVAVSVLCFGPSVMKERISRCNQGLQQSKIKSGERNTGQKFRYDGSGY